MVKYHLIENRLTDRADDFMAQTQSAAAFDRDAVIDRILQRGTLLTKTDILAVLNSFEETIIDIIQEGNTVSMPLFHTAFSISGVFNGPMDAFDQLRHKLNINLSKGSLIREAQSTIKLEKTDTVAPSLYILEVKDSVSGAVNGSLTPSGVLEIYGSHIKLEGSDPNCGIYFVNGLGEETKVVTIVQNKPSTVIVAIPALAAGVYQIKIVTQYNGGSQTKRPRDYTFDHDLTVS